MFRPLCIDRCGGRLLTQISCLWSAIFRLFVTFTVILSKITGDSCMCIHLQFIDVNDAERPCFSSYEGLSSRVYTLTIHYQMSELRRICRDTLVYEIILLVNPASSEKHTQHEPTLTNRKHCFSRTLSSTVHGESACL